MNIRIGKYQYPLEITHITTAIVAMIVSYGSSAVIVFQAATALGATDQEINSWLTSLALACGLGTIILSLVFRNPILIAWSTPGAVLIATTQNIPMADAVGAFIVSALFMTILGVTGVFAKLVKWIPPTIASAMLAGILLRFGTNIFNAMNTEMTMVGLMLVAYLLSKIRLPRYSIMLMLFLGFTYAFATGKLNLSEVHWVAPQLTWLSPHFTFSSIMSVGMPLFLITLATQQIPGISVLRAYHYQTPASPLIATTGFITLLLAPFGAFMTNLAAISASVCMGEDVDKDPRNRFMATVWSGCFYLVLAVLGGVVVALFAAFPQELLLATAGIAILGTLSSNLSVAMDDSYTREASLVTMLASASGLSFLGIGGAFWGLIMGMILYNLTKKRH